MRRSIAVVVLALSLLPGWAVNARAGSSELASPRTLVIALDGVPLRSVQEAVNRGAFAGWSRPRGMISTFPSMTGVAFTAILKPFCVHPIAGYETLYFDRQDNATIGGTSRKYLEENFPWRTHFVVRKLSFGSKVAGYSRPMHQARKMVGTIEDLVLQDTTDPVLAHVAATDVVTHVRGDEPIIKYLLELDKRLGDLEQKHEKKWGRPLRIVMLSDHGNTQGGVSSAGELRHDLRDAGFRIRKKLGDVHDVVIPAYGAVSYSALYLEPERAAAAARAAVENPGVDLAAWLEGAGEARLLSGDGEAVIRWRKLPDSREFSYDAVSGDPLRLGPRKDDLATSGRLRSDGFATGEDWLQATVDHGYPDPLRRLVDALAGTWVDNPADVILSLYPERAWGSKKAWVGSFLMGGGLEGTHGALDAESTMGFLIANEPMQGEVDAVPADRVLSRWFAEGDCVGMTRVE